MPLNVTDNYGKHVGVCVAKFMNKYVVALTQETIDNYMTPFHEQIKTKAAEAWQLKNIFGKINEEKFPTTLKQWLPAIKEEHFHLGKSLSLYALNKEDLHPYGLVKAFPSATYILTEGKFMDDYYNIKLSLSVSRIPGLGLAKSFPGMVGEVAEMPEVFTNKLSTYLIINTGDSSIELSVPGTIITKKGEEIALQVDFVNQKVVKLLTREMLYHL